MARFHLHPIVLLAGEKWELLNTASLDNIGTEVQVLRVGKILADSPTVADQLR